MNRVQGASQGFMEKSSQFNMGWILVTVLVVVAIFYVGYTFLKKREGRRRRFF